MASIAELAKKLNDGDPAVAHKAYRDIEDIATRASDPANDKRADVAAQLAEQLHARGEPKKDKNGNEKPGDLIHGKRARNQIMRLMAYVASAKEVPALESVLGDLDLREMARFALDRNTSKAATQALIKALETQVGPTFRAGVVNALGERSCKCSIPSLQKATEDPDREVRMAAIDALAKHPDPANDAFIAKAAKSKCCQTRKQANKARVRLAEALCKAGDKATAKKIYKAIATGDADCPQKKAAKMALETM
jgi:HEAT repeat protein